MPLEKCGCSVVVSTRPNITKQRPQVNLARALNSSCSWQSRYRLTSLRVSPTNSKPEFHSQKGLDQHVQASPPTYIYLPRDWKCRSVWLDADFLLMPRFGTSRAGLNFWSKLRILYTTRFNIKELYSLPTQVSFVHFWKQTAIIFLSSIKRFVFLMETQRVYCEVWTEFLNLFVWMSYVKGTACA
jgi:hypothetical protein